MMVSPIRNIAFQTGFYPAVQSRGIALAVGAASLLTIQNVALAAIALTVGCFLYNVKSIKNSAKSWYSAYKYQVAVLRIVWTKVFCKTTLDLSGLELTSLPPEIGQLTQLKHLEIGNNRLSSLPPEIGQLTQLEHLIIGNNRLSSLPPEIGQLTQLKYLHIKKNQFSFLPPEIGQLTQLKYLHIKKNQFSFLPPEIGRLTQLEYLSIKNNQLLSLPPEIDQLTQLKHLEIENNRLLSLPPEIGQLAQLNFLNIESNRLSSLPREIGQLTQLNFLIIANNWLSSLPPEIGSCLNLNILVVRNNPGLSELPLSLGDIPGITFLSHRGTRILDTTIDTILQACKAKRTSSFFVESMPQRLALWKKYGANEANLEHLLELKENQKIIICEWLLRLSKTKDFSKNQSGLAKTVCEMLETLRTNETFRELFFSQAEANNTECEDRAAQAFNELYGFWRLCTMNPNASLQEKVELIKGVSRTIALRNAIARLLSKREKVEKESVEIYLYYETTLREKLGLITAIKTMVYSDIGKRNWIDIAALEAEVEATYLSVMAAVPATLQLAESDSSFVKQKDKIKTEADEKLAELDGQKESLSDVAYNERSRAIMAEREGAIQEAVIGWLKHGLKH